MKRKIPTVTLLAVALLAAGGIATAAAQTNAPANPSRSHARINLDANGDGAIDRTEAGKVPSFAAKFDQLDANKDGRLTKDERAKAWGGHGSGRHHGRGGGMERLDNDADGRISRSEFDASKAAMDQRMAGRGDAGHKRPAFDFASADSNRDGYLVRSELRSYHDRMRPQREAEMAKREAEKFAGADINRDGKLSRLEVTEKMPRMQKSFAWMDENRDGFLSRDELKRDHGR